MHVSADYFQKTFRIVTGLSIGEYIRNRRLTLAGEELQNTQEKVIDAALKYGYDSPDSFTKAFTRFHGVSPAAARSSGVKLKRFSPLSIHVFLRGGFQMNRKIIPNLPEIGYYGNATDFGVNLLSAAFQVAGTKMSRAELSFYSGMANHFCWIENDWVGSRGCECFGADSETPFEEELRLLKTMGWSATFTIVTRDAGGAMLNTDEEQIKRDFTESIDKGYPILSRFTTNHRYNLIIGYEDGGGKIICKEAVDEAGGSGRKDAETFLHENWPEVILDYILLKERLEPVPERRRFLDQLQRVTAHARRTNPIKGSILTGIAAWNAYLDMLEQEDLSALPLEDDTHTGKDCLSLRLGIYCDGLCQIWERHGALDYYRQLADTYPQWRRELETAAASFEECSKYSGFLWTQGIQFEGEGLEKFRDPALRKTLADEGRKALEKEIEAVEQFEAILKKEGLR